MPRRPSPLDLACRALVAVMIAATGVAVFIVIPNLIYAVFE